MPDIQTPYIIAVPMVINKYDEDTQTVIEDLDFRKNYFPASNIVIKKSYGDTTVNEYHLLDNPKQYIKVPIYQYTDNTNSATLENFNSVLKIAFDEDLFTKINDSGSQYLENDQLGGLKTELDALNTAVGNNETIECNCAQTFEQTQENALNTLQQAFSSMLAPANVNGASTLALIDNNLLIPTQAPSQGTMELLQ